MENPTPLRQFRTKVSPGWWEHVAKIFVTGEEHSWESGSNASHTAESFESDSIICTNRTNRWTSGSNSQVYPVIFSSLDLRPALGIKPLFISRPPQISETVFASPSQPKHPRINA